jgi:HAD superfamily hydrolase (TIGR01509 family)
MLVIFDCDGVLVDSEIISGQVLCECLQEEGINASEREVLERYRGKSVADCIGLITEHLTQAKRWQGLAEPERAERGAKFWRHVQLQTLVACAERLQPVAGVAQVLSYLQANNIAFCVASNGKHEKMAKTLVTTDLLKFVEGRVFSFEDVARSKPAPDLFLHAASSLGIAAAQAVVVEDSLTGIQAALAAGMRPLAYCPPDADGSDNMLLAEMRALGAECFFAMDELIPLLLQPTAE